MDELEIALIVLLDETDGLSDAKRTEAIHALVKEIPKPDEGIRAIKSFLINPDLTDSARIVKINTYVAQRRKTIDNRKATAMNMAQINNESTRILGSRREVSERDRFRDDRVDECRINLCCIKMDLCCFFPTWSRMSMGNGARTLFLVAVVALFFRVLYYNVKIF